MSNPNRALVSELKRTLSQIKHEQFGRHGNYCENCKTYAGRNNLNLVDI